MKKSVTRLTFNAALVAVYIVLSMPMFTLRFGGFKLTFEHFPVVLGAIMFGPVDGILIGLVGEFINQLTTFGITPTTILWVLPIMARGAIVGFSTYLFPFMKVKVVTKRSVPIVFAIVCVVSGVVSSCLNTLALYCDSKLFGYYTYALVFGSLLVRLLLSAITSIMIVVVITPILRALKQAKLI